MAKLCNGKDAVDPSIASQKLCHFDKLTRWFRSQQTAGDFRSQVDADKRHEHRLSLEMMSYYRVWLNSVFDDSVDLYLFFLFVIELSK